MRAKFSFILFILIFVFSSNGIWGLEIYGGKLVEVVAADSGYTDSTIATKFEDGWRSSGPTQFDVDKDGNVYIQDRFDCQVQKYDKSGKWVFSFSIPGKRTRENPSGRCSPYTMGDITVVVGQVPCAPDKKRSQEHTAPDLQIRYRHFFNLRRDLERWGIFPTAELWGTPAVRSHPLGKT